MLKQPTFWKTYYGNNKKYFLYEIQLEINKILHPDLYPTQPIQVTPVSMPASSPVSRQEVLKRDNHRCLCCGMDFKPQLQLDHIVARSHGGDDSLTNLQTLCLTCNGSKGDTTLNFLQRSTLLRTPPSAFRVLPLPSVGQVSKDQEWERYLRRSINFFYQCAAVEKVTLQSDKWQITLHPGNDPNWFKPYLQDSLKRIQARYQEAWLSTPVSLEIISSDYAAVTTNGTTSHSNGKMASRKFSQLPSGTLCRFSYRGSQFRGKILQGKLIVEGKRGGFTSFSAASEAATKTSRNGWLDWELQLPGTQEWVLADNWRHK